MKKLSCALILWIALTFIAQIVPAKDAAIAPPKAKIVPRISRFHGEEITDNYYWLRNSKDPDVLAYLKAENAYAAQMMKHTEKLQDTLYREMRSRLKETDLSVPQKLDGYVYYKRMEEGKQYPVYCRKKDTSLALLKAAAPGRQPSGAAATSLLPAGANEEILLDQNELAKGSEYCEIGVFKISPDHRHLAYSVDRTGAELYTVHFKDLQKNQVFAESVPNTYYGGEWANDNRTYFYNTLDAAKRAHRIYRHTLGTDSKQDVLVFEEKDERFWVSLSKSRSEAYLWFRTASNTSSEVRFLEAENPQGSLQILQPRRQNVEYSADHHGDQFYILTNERAPQFRLARAPADQLANANWVDVIPHRPEVLLESIDLFKNHLVVYERDRGVQKIRVQDLTNRSTRYVEFGERVYTLTPSENDEFSTDTFQFEYESLVTPTSIYEYNMRTNQRRLLKRTEVIGYAPAQYVMERTWAKAKDGARVPISVVYRKGTPKNGTAPVYLFGYGAYGSNWELYFSAERFSLLDRGFVYAVAHIRGGGFLGRNWYEQGKLMNKMNTFTDFIAAAEHLIASNYAARDKVVISGLSAGGLLMGAVTNLRPDLFRVVIANVPYVDVINDMSDPTIPLVVIEYEEWGNTQIAEQYHYMKAYSPYDNVVAKKYPAMLLTASWNDPRVPYWEAAKWAAKLRANKTDRNVLLLKTNLGGAGHGGSSGRYDQLKETAFEYAFILDQLGMLN